MTLSPVILSDDLIAEVLSLLPVNSLLRFRCVCKSWKTLISDAAFMKLHLKRSSTRNPHFTLITVHIPNASCIGRPEYNYRVIPCPISRLIDNPPFTLAVVDPYYLSKDKVRLNIVGSCNGLICLAHNFFTVENGGYWFSVWNPATRTTSEDFGYFCDLDIRPRHETRKYQPHYNFKFGCDNSTDTYKVVASSYNIQGSIGNVRILSVGNNVWRDIESFPANPLYWNTSRQQGFTSVGVYLSDTLNWLAFHKNFRYYNIELYVIVSLNLGTETYRKYMLPRGFDEALSREPNIGLCGGCLCFSYSYKETDFVIWQMKKFGVEESWTQFLKISYLQLGFDISDDMIKYIQLFFEDDDTLILESNGGPGFKAIRYNWRDNRVEQTGVSATITNRATNGDKCWYLVRGFADSLISIC